MTTRVENIERYLRARLAETQARDEKTAGPQVHPFVTISRQTGAGGYHLAEAMLDVFAQQEDVDLFGGWQVFDHRLCEIVADDPRFEKSMDSLLSEEYHSKTDDFFHQIFGAGIDQHILMERVFLVVRSLAQMGKAIIVGRAGSQVTKGLGPGLRLRLVAPEDERIIRVMEFYDLNERDARSEARRRDSDRARLLKKHFSADIDDPQGYDAVWNTGTVSFEEIAEAVVAILRHRAIAP
jgi:hypothetical protein